MMFMQLLRPSIRASVIALCLITSVSHAQLNLELPETDKLPNLGSTASSALSTTEERLIGQLLFRETRKRHALIEDPELSGWIRALGNRLTRHAPASGSNFYFSIEKDSAVNAYAMVGGVIVIHSGLILNTSSESELAAVMAHEIAHVTQRHIARMMANNKKNPLITGAGFLAGAMVASKSSEAAQAIMMGTIAAQAHNNIVFSHQAETEADRTGLRILAGAGFNPRAMSHFMEKLDRQNSDIYGDIAKYVRTHPMSIDRLSDTRTLANQMGKRPIREDNDYLYMREKLRILTGQRAAPLSNDPQLQRYSQALQQQRAGNYQGVIKTLGTQSRHLPTALLIAHALNRLQRSAETERLLMPLSRVYPGQEALVLPLAEALANNGKTAQAWQLLNNTRITESTSLEFLEKKQALASRSGHPDSGLLTAAERSIRLGEYKHAKALLERATRVQGSGHNKARMQALLNEIKQAEGQKRTLDKF